MHVGTCMFGCCLPGSVSSVRLRPLAWQASPGEGGIQTRLPHPPAATLFDIPSPLTSLATAMQKKLSLMAPEKRNPPPGWAKRSRAGWSDLPAVCEFHLLQPHASPSACRRARHRCRCRCRRHRGSAAAKAEPPAETGRARFGPGDRRRDRFLPEELTPAEMEGRVDVDVLSLGPSERRALLERLVQDHPSSSLSRTALLPLACASAASGPGAAAAYGDPVVLSLDAEAVRRLSARPAELVVSVHAGPTGSSCGVSASRALGRVRVAIDVARAAAGETVIARDGWVTAELPVYGVRARWPRARRQPWPWTWSQASSTSRSGCSPAMYSCSSPPPTNCSMECQQG
ncbi:uncharacterized protein [Miscanthus floridulus]